MKELRRLALEGVADKLENPSDDEKNGGVEPKAVEEKTGEANCDRQEDCRNAEGMAKAVHRVLVTGRVLRNPFLVRAVLAGASAKHAAGIILRFDEI